MAFDSKTILQGTVSTSGVTEVLHIPSNDLLNAKIMVKSLSGTTPTVQFTFQVSEDGTNFVDEVSTHVFTEATKDFKEFYYKGNGDYTRVSITVSGTAEYFIGIN